jgi:hypothetical protein
VLPGAHRMRLYTSTLLILIEICRAPSLFKEKDIPLPFYDKIFASHWITDTEGMYSCYSFVDVTHQRYSNCWNKVQ